MKNFKTTAVDDPTDPILQVVETKEFLLQRQLKHNCRTKSSTAVVIQRYEEVVVSYLRFLGG